MISEQEIIYALSLLKINKAAGQDGIPSEMLKACMSNHFFVRVLKHHFNRILTNGIFPDEWRMNNLTPIHKKGRKCDPQNYRGIAVGSAISKLFSLVLNNRLTKFMEENNLIPENQIGFRKGYRTSDHVLTLKTIIDKYLHKCKKHMYVCFVDFKSAYDTVWRDGLIYKMMLNGFSTKFTKIISNMLHNIL